MTTNIFENQSIKEFASRVENLTGGAFKPLGISKATIRVQIPDTSYFEDLYSINFQRGGDCAVTVLADDGSEAPADCQPTAAEAASIKAYLTTVNWPKFEFINLGAGDLPALWQQAEESDRWVFRDKDGNVVMLQVKTLIKGQKSYIPITRWSGGYEYVEPDVRPIYNDHLIGQRNASTVFISEGGKAADAGQRIADDEKSDHPWKSELSNAVHLGLTGGAASLSKTDLTNLKRRGVKTIYVVADNDKVGLKGAHKVAKKLDGTVYIVRVGDAFPTSWDLADDMPAKFYKNGRWIGPSFASTVFPATQATRAYVDDKGKPRHALKQEFSDQWFFATETAEFIHRQFPEIQKIEKGFNDYVAPWSAVDDTAKLLKRDGSCHIDAAVYRPGISAGGVLTENKRRLFNVWRPNDLAAIDGDISPWTEFLSYLLPDEIERQEFKRWFYTLIGSPQTRMHYSCLMYSEQTGTGKSICGSVLYQIVGQRNAVIANPSALDSSFNSHFENKQLVIFNELYEGGSNFKTTNALKTVQTDDFIRINAKYRNEKTVENHTHLFAASNSEHALDIDDHDRRWLIVQTTATPWPKEKFAALAEWLFDDIGCNVILAEAQKFADYVKKGERAPVTEAKKTTIFHTKSEVVLNLESFDEAHHDDTVAVELSMFQGFVTSGKNVPKSDSVTVNSQRIKKLGWGVLNQRDTEFDGFRPSIGGKPKVMIVSPALKLKMHETARDNWNGLIKEALIDPAHIY